MKKQTKTIYSFGHSSKPLATFLNKLADYKIEVVVDVRTFPTSRYLPYFNKNALHSELAKRAIKYLWKGKNLGGRGVNVRYEETIDELSEMAKNGTRVCVMCSEGEYKKCHRYLVLTPSFEERGLSVTHIEYENDTRKRTHKRK